MRRGIFVNTKLLPWWGNSTPSQHPGARHTLLGNVSLSKGQVLQLGQPKCARKPLKISLLGWPGFFATGWVDRREKWAKSHVVTKWPKKLGLDPTPTKDWDGMAFMVKEGEVPSNSSLHIPRFGKENKLPLPTLKHPLTINAPKTKLKIFRGCWLHGFPINKRLLHAQKRLNQRALLC